MQNYFAKDIFSLEFSAQNEIQKCAYCGAMHCCNTSSFIPYDSSLNFQYHSHEYNIAAADIV